MISFEYFFEPSSAAAAALGPKHLIPAWASASATPATSGASGPITTNCTCSACAAATMPATSSALTASTRTSSAMPALPGVQMISGERDERARAALRACSRPPPPTTSTRGRAAGRAWPPPGASLAPELASETANEVVDRDRGQGLVLGRPAGTELERHARDRALVRRLDHVHEVKLTEGCPLALDRRSELLDLAIDLTDPRG